MNFSEKTDDTSVWIDSASEAVSLEPEWDPYDVFVNLTSSEFQKLYASDEDDI